MAGTFPLACPCAIPSSSPRICQSNAYFHLPYRQTEEGIAQGHAKGIVPSIPDYTTINRRINKLDIKIKDAIDDSSKPKDEYIVIAIDSTGIKVTNRGQWMRDKWNIKK